jgi:hypothetical protein
LWYYLTMELHFVDKNKDGGDWNFRNEQDSSYLP